ncbi:response regulator transcription factor [Sulfurimonas sp.]|uniref:response regulator transcription factor n=1 Tax=Sulfurimonas sp. TaxID=2022749 RepID=UPI002B4A198E|nr:response regulator transcription factor [Sulfurimonas sp.]
MINILMIEDDTEFAQILIQYLSQFNISITNYEDPFLALSAISLKTYDLVILDLTLPGMDGLEVCKELVEKHDIPIIISSARSDITDKVIALELGADDYLPKPYDPRELEVRIKTILRRFNKSLESTNKLNTEIFHLNKEKKEITKNTIPLELTFAEYQIFSLLCENKASIISRYDILESMEADSDGTGGSIAVLINRIRSKIEENPKKPHYLLTVRGMGYKLVE